MEGENGGVWTNLNTPQSRHSNFRLGILLCSLPQEIQEPLQARGLLHKGFVSGCPALLVVS